MRSDFAEAEQALRRTAGFAQKIGLAHPLHGGSSALKTMKVSAP